MFTHLYDSVQFLQPVVIAVRVTEDPELPIGVYIAIGTVVYILLVYLLMCFRQSKRVCKIILGTAK